MSGNNVYDGRYTNSIVYKVTLTGSDMIKFK